MLLQQIHNKRVIFLSGKGGVGKTTISLAVAKGLAALGKKTLIVELKSAGQIARIYNKESSAETPVSLEKNIHTLNLCPKVCFREYVLMQIKSKTLFKVFFGNALMQNFLNAVPGLNELLLLGKIWHLQTQEDFDCLIIDAPASGHSQSLLEVPDVAFKAIRVGPLAENSKRISELLKDPKRCGLIWCTLAEDMPATESQEFLGRLKKQKAIAIDALVINALRSPLAKLSPKSQRPDNLLKLYQFHQSQAKINQEYSKALQSHFKTLACAEVPFVYSGLESPTDWAPLQEAL